MALNETISTNATNSSGSRGPSMEHLIDPDANPVFGFWINGVAIILVGIVGIFGNCASIRVLSHKQMRSSVNFILIALASSDLVLIVTAILLFGLTTVFPYNGMLKDYYFVIQPQIAKVVFPLAMIGELLNVISTRKAG
jgi:Serpentine type 7TM GPCR chemoreceptor Srw